MWFRVWALEPHCQLLIRQSGSQSVARKVVSMEPQNVTSFGNGIFGDVIS